MTPKKYSFSGHESFSCKSLWLKKGFDFVANDIDFNAPEAVVALGVGKNMVSAIRFWMRAFSMTENDTLTPLSYYLFDSESGKDPFMEDLGTLWLLHFHLVNSCEATLYNWFFLHFQKERKHFERQHVVSFVHRKLTEYGKQNLYNENTVKKDVGVLLQNYIVPEKVQGLDDYSSLLLDLDLLRQSEGKSYVFNIEGKRRVPSEIFLYAILTMKGADNTVSYDILQDVGLLFCMNDMEVISMCREIESNRPDSVKYSDTAGVRQLLFIKNLNPLDILNEYYG